MPKQQQRNEPEFGWQNLSIWEREPQRGSKTTHSGYLQMTEEFLYHLVDSIEAGELKPDREGRIQLGVVLRENQDPQSDNSPHYLGNLFELEEEEEKPAHRGGSRRASRREEPEEPQEDPRRSGKRRRRREEPAEEDVQPRRRKRSL